MNLKKWLALVEAEAAGAVEVRFSPTFHSAGKLRFCFQGVGEGEAVELTELEAVGLEVGLVGLVEEVMLAVATIAGKGVFLTCNPSTF